jgi:hypothetical protein
VSHSATPSLAVDLLLTAVFVLVCRWVKRNPSNFLRFALFPFGGLNVERWPRFMLVFVKVCAAAGFFVLLLTFADLLALESPAHPATAILCAKYAVAILISLFALKGTAEPMESYETPKFGTPSNKPSATPNNVPAAPENAAAKPTGVPAPPLFSARPAAPTPPPPPAAGPSQHGLSDAQAPPLPNRSNPLCAPPPGVVKERMVTIGSSFLMGVIFVGFFYLLGVNWLAVAFLIFFSLAIVILFFARNAPVGSCPFCGGLIHKYNRLKPEPVRCEQCGEISKFANEKFSPYEANAVSATPMFRSLLYENGVWPNGCVQCGAPPVRLDSARAIRYQSRRLFTPLASSVLAPHPAAQIAGVPYCAQHRDAIDIIPPKEAFSWTPWKYLPGFEQRMEQRRTAFLMWRSLPMMRRYLEANRRAKSAVSSGYREPTYVQKKVFGAVAKP